MRDRSIKRPQAWKWDLIAALEENLLAQTEYVCDGHNIFDALLLIKKEEEIFMSGEWKNLFLICFLPANGEAWK